MNTKNKHYVCTKLRLYSYLAEKGEYPECRRVDKYNPKFFIWLYPDTENVRRLVNEYYDKLAKYKSQK